MGRPVDGRKIAQGMKAVLRERISKMDVKPMLVGLVAGGADADDVYIRMREKTAEEVGAATKTVRMDSDSSTTQVVEVVRRLSEDPGVHGIILHRPFPEHIDSLLAAAAVPPEKDVEGMHSCNLGRLVLGQHGLVPATPGAVMHILDEEDVCLRGKDVVVVSHSPIVGKPLAMMLLNRDATVHVCHVHTRDIERFTRIADVLVTAAGVPGLVGADMVKEGCVVVDVSMNRKNGALCGDVVYDEVLEKASLVTPVPGGVGPVTNAFLFNNLLSAVELQK